jgi:preprotein translocase subunit SecD
LLACEAGCGRQKGVTAYFEVDPQRLTEGELATSQKLNLVDSAVTTMQGRLGRRGRVTQIGGLIQVEFFGELSPPELEELKRRLTARGDFEFLIMAHPTAVANQTIVAAAQSLPFDVKELVVDDKLAAKWVVCRDSSTLASKTLLQRQEGDVTEALALVDTPRITGEYLAAAEPGLTDGVNGSPQHSLLLEFDKRGAFLMEQLTSANLPTATGERRALAIILDDVLLSAPSINAVISDRAIIEGISAAEVESMTAILSYGTLPVPVREVEKPQAAK